jgi:signal transduction histidine kinase
LLQWVLGKKWLPEIIFTAIAVLFVPVFDFLVQGQIAFLCGLSVALSVFFFRKLTFLSPVFIAAGAIGDVLLGQLPLISSATAVITVFLAGTFGKRVWSLLTLVVVAATGLFVAWNTSFNTPLLNNFYGVSIYNETGRWTGFGFASLTIAGLLSMAWISGAFWRSNSLQRQAARERDFITRVNLRTSLDTAELNERFSIARDLNELVMQRISAMLTISDGARYAAKVDAGVAVRNLDRLAELIRGVHEEMRRLFDMLNMSVAVAVAPPGIADIDTLSAQYRELGYPTRVTHHGQPLELIASAQLNIYRIVFDALENVQQHAPLGTAIDVDLTWSNQGLQVLVKDNGIEVSNSGVAELTGISPSYDHEEDLKALTQEITGAGITGMLERAQLFQGNVEARRVPGVGVTVNAIFPGIENFLAEKDN